MGEEKEEGMASPRYWPEKEEEESELALFTPFFVCLAADTLEPESFRLCISQINFHFLQAFLQVYDRIEESYAADDDETKSAIRHLRESLLNKLHTYHTHVLQEWGLELPKDQIIPQATAAKYRDFLIATASGEGVLRKNKVSAYTIAAIAPFMRLYLHLFHIILTNLDGTSHVYKKWLQEIKELALETENLLDKFSAPLTEEERTETDKLYHEARKLQLEFFASQPISQPTVVPLARVQNLNKTTDHQLTIFSNFDLTCSDDDSTNVLALQVIKTSTFSPKELEALSDQYIDGFKQCVDRITPGAPGEAFDYDGLRNALEHLEEYEKWSNARVEELKLLKGLDLDAIHQAGRHHNLHLQKGCAEFFEKILKNGSTKFDVHIISHCWCGDLIRSAFSPGLEVLNIHSNELATEVSITTGKTLTTGEIVKKVESPFDKLKTFKEVVEGHKSSRSSSSTSTSSDHQGKHLKIYIGDEVGDILCLVEADIGIVFGSSDTLRKLGKHFGVSFVPLLQGVVNNQMGLGVWEPLSGTLYTVSSWAEIQAFILGL